MNDLTILDAMKERLLSVEPPIGYAIRAVHTPRLAPDIGTAVLGV